jgi:hypothetical protein
VLQREKRIERIDCSRHIRAGRRGDAKDAAFLPKPRGLIARIRSVCKARRQISRRFGTTLRYRRIIANCHISLIHSLINTHYSIALFIIIVIFQNLFVIQNLIRNQ